MNKNKGIIGIGLILAIILGIAVVGGGAYYLGKSSSKSDVNIPIVNQKQEVPVIDNNQQVNVANPTNPVVLTGCTSSSVPSIKVLSPNGGEVYKVGDKITVKWSSCNIPATHKFYIGLMPNVESQGSPAITVLSASTINDGIEIFNLNINDTDLSYTIFMKDNDLPNGSTNAWSNKFTINPSPTKTISTANWKTYTDADYGFSFQYPDTWSLYYGPDNAIGRNGEIMAHEINFINTVDKNATEGSGVSNSRTTLSVKYHLPPYGAELYKSSLSDYESNSGLYKTDAKKIQVAGSIALKGSTIITVDGKGHIINPADELTIVTFLDKKQTGDFDLVFTTYAPNDVIEIPNFEKLLTTFKFN